MTHQNTNLIRTELIKQYQFKQSGEWLRRGVCPSCGKRELYTHAENPVMVKCGREAKCRFAEKAKDLLPDLFVDFNKKYPALDKNPKATANAYMELVRGINPVKYHKNWSQDKYWHPRGDKGTATVRFHLNKSVYMDRFIEAVTVAYDDGTVVKRKMSFSKAPDTYKGLWWQPQGMDIKDDDEIWIVEGCIDALSLWSKGIKAVAALSCNNYPDQMLDQFKGKNIRWVWALDNDAAGTAAIKKFYRQLSETGETCLAAVTRSDDKKTDWNDCLLGGKINDKFIEDCKYYGALLVAKSPTEKALLMWHKKQQNGFILTFASRTYWFSLEYEKYLTAREGLIQAADKDEVTLSETELADKAAELAGAIVQIANCQIDYLYFMRNEITDESWYYVRIDFPHGGRSVKSSISGGQIATAPEFKKRLLSIGPGAVYTGKSHHHDYILSSNLYGIRTVGTVDFIGYSKENKAYIFNDKAVSGGKVYDMNAEDYFQIDTLSIKSLLNTPHFIIGDEAEYDDTWKTHYWNAFAEKGVVALAFFIGSLFAEQIRLKDKSFPFLEIVGQAGSGKTTLIEFLFKLIGWPENEGFDPVKATAAARARKFSQVSNLPIGLIESDRGDDTAKTKAFDWEELKTAYNGRSFRSRGLKNSGNDTYDPPFRGSLLIAQNNPVNASAAILSRILHLDYDTSNHTDDGKISADFLSTMPIETISNFLLQVTAREEKILTHFFDRAPKHETKIRADDLVRTVRIGKNHGQIMALAEIAGGVLKLDHAQKKTVADHILQMARKREHAIKADHVIVREFWDAYDYLTTGPDAILLNHSRNDDYIAIRLNEFQARAKQRDQKIADNLELKRHLKNSIKYKFIASKAVNSAIDEMYTHRCWVFRKPKEQDL